MEVEDEGRLTSLERVEGLGVKEGREAGFVEEIYLREVSLSHRLYLGRILIETGREDIESPLFCLSDR